MAQYRVEITFHVKGEDGQTVQTIADLLTSLAMGKLQGGRTEVVSWGLSSAEPEYEDRTGTEQ